MQASNQSARTCVAGCVQYLGAFPSQEAACGALAQAMLQRQQTLAAVPLVAAGAGLTAAAAAAAPAAETSPQAMPAQQQSQPDGAQSAAEAGSNPPGSVGDSVAGAATGLGTTARSEAAA